MTGPGTPKPQARKGRSWRQRGILVMLSLLFAGSGLLRLGAFDLAFAATGDGAEVAGEHGAEGPGPHAGHGGSCPTIASVDTALGAIRGRAAELDARDVAIADRQARLDAAEALVSARLEELEAAEARLSDLLTMADGAAASDIAALVQLYESMGPDAAAELFARMEPSFAAGFLSRMRPEAGAALLAELDPEQAYAISVILATRNADLPVSAEAAAALRD